jgi:diguanylate cyclase (GGDEF)-like protein
MRPVPVQLADREQPSVQPVREPRKSCARQLTRDARRSRSPSEPSRAASRSEVTLDATDLDALLELLRAEDLADAQQCAGRLRTLLGQEGSLLEAHVAAALSRTAELQHAKRLASTDALTGVANRRTFVDALRRELARTQRSPGSISVLMFDIDGFKSVNDSQGHAAGDQVLRLFGRCAREPTRKGDLVARLGGDEFAVMLPATRAEEARAIGERIRARFEHAQARDPRLSVSLGVAETKRPCADALALLATVDAALYRDKAARKARAAAAVLQPMATG